MHYYHFNIGDYASHTQGLSLIEDIAYRRLIDQYYLSQRPLKGDVETISRSIGMREYFPEVSYILEKFFISKKGKWIHARIDRDIAEYKKGQKDKSKAGKASAEARRLKAIENAEKTSQQALDSVEHALNKCATNQEPITINHKPITSNQLDYSCWPQQPAQQTLDDWLAMRKRLKANVSQTVINRFASELKKAVQFGYSVDFCLQECVTRNWRGFEVQWLLNSGVSHAQSKRFTQPSDNRDKAARAADEAFGIAERGIFEGDFTRADPYGLIEQPERGAVQDLDEGPL